MIVKRQEIGRGQHLHIFFQLREHCLGNFKFRECQRVFNANDSGVFLINAIAGTQTQLDGGAVAGHDHGNLRETQRGGGDGIGIDHIQVQLVKKSAGDGICGAHSIAVAVGLGSQGQNTPPLGVDAAGHTGCGKYAGNIGVHTAVSM